MASSSSRQARSGHQSAPAAEAPAGRSMACRAPDQDGRRRQVAVVADLHRRIMDPAADASRWRGPGRTPALPAPPGRSDRAARARARAAASSAKDACARGAVDQAPLQGLLTADPFGAGGEHVGQVAPDVALVDQPGEAAGAGQHAEQGDLGQRHGR